MGTESQLMQIFPKRLFQMPRYLIEWKKLNHEGTQSPSILLVNGPEIQKYFTFIGQCRRLVEYNLKYIYVIIFVFYLTDDLLVQCFRPFDTWFIGFYNNNNDCGLINKQ